MTLQATVLIPTHNHGPTLVRAVNSVLAQTVKEIEVFVIGDGVPDVTRELVAVLLRRDDRVRFFDNSKGPRHGEIYRHAALAEARGEIVCYLSDDDLYLPNHVEMMRRLLSASDFAHALPLRVDPGDALGGWTVDLSLPADREMILSVGNQIPLSCGAHTLDMYRRLPYGWRTTPQDTPTDLYMWRQFLADPHCQAVSGTRPTVLSFPNPQRADWTTDERCAELDRWSRRLSDAAWHEIFVLDVLDYVVRDRAAHAALCRGEINFRCSEVDFYRNELALSNSSITVRVRNGILSFPVLGRALTLLYKAVKGRPVH